MLDNKKGGIQGIIGTVFIGFIAIIFIIAVLPSIAEMMKTPQQSTSLNCPGYVDSTPSLSYNSSLQSNTFGCTGIKLLPGFLVLGVIIAVVMALMYGGNLGNQDQGYQ